MFGTCEECGATCTKVYIVSRDPERGECLSCIVKKDTGAFGFDNSSLRELAIHAQRIKANIKTATVYGPNAPVKRGAPIPELFWLNVFLLADVEKSIVKKGADPSHPCF